MKALCIGVHVLDVLVRPVEAIPDGDGALVEEIRLTAAGSAGGTALVLARLGAEVRSAGAVGTDAAGDMLLALLEREGIDTSLLLRREDAPTSASVLPISPSGDRPAWHVIGANGAFGAGRRGPRRGRRRVARAPRRAGVHGRRGRGEGAGARARARRRHLRRRARARRAGPARLDRARARARGLPAAQPRAGARLHGRRRRRRGLARAARPRRALRHRHARRRRRPDRRQEAVPRSTSRSSTPRAAATPSPPASCAASRSAATAAPPRSSAAPPPRSSPRAWAPTPAPTTSPPPRRSPPERRRARSTTGPFEGASGVERAGQPTPLGDCERIHSRSVSSPTRA